MGAHDAITEGGWTWTDGSPFRYINWAAGDTFIAKSMCQMIYQLNPNAIKISIFPLTVKGNPDDYFGEDCLSILISSGWWNDDNCDNKRGYICKRRGTFICIIYTYRCFRCSVLGISEQMPFLFSQETHLNLHRHTMVCFLLKSLSHCFAPAKRLFAFVEIGRAHV